MEPGRACGSSQCDGSTLGSTLLESAAFRGLFTPTPRRGAHCWMRSARQRRAGYRPFWKGCWKSTTRTHASDLQCFQELLLFAAARLVIRLGDGTADLQVVEGGAIGGRRPPQCPVIYSDTSINISGLPTWILQRICPNDSRSRKLTFVGKLLFTLGLKWAVSVRFMELTLSATFLLDHLLLAIRQGERWVFSFDKCYYTKHYNI